MKTRGLKPQSCGNLVLRSSEEEIIKQKRMRGSMLEVREEEESDFKKSIQGLPGDLWLRICLAMQGQGFNPWFGK